MQFLQFYTELQVKELHESKNNPEWLGVRSGYMIVI